MKNRHDYVRELIDDQLEKIKEAETVRCPYCNEIFWRDGYRDTWEVSEQVISVWGEEEHDVYCDNCDKEFIVKELVSRTFKSRKK